MQTPLHIRQKIEENLAQHDTFLDLGEQGLLTVPDEIRCFTHLQRLRLNDNAIQRLPSWLNELPNLQFIELYGNPLHELSSVRRLVLNWGVWKRLQPDPTQIAGLWLRWENPRVIEELKLLPDLRSLDLSGQRLRELPIEITQLHNLTQLDLQNNQLSTLPLEMVQLQNLSLLDLGYNKFSTMPLVITQLQNLAQLYLDSNQLSVLPSKIAQLQNLAQLYLGSNKFNALPPEITQLQNLETIILYNNQFNTLPLEVIQLQNLKLLTLGGNSLETLSPAIAQLQNLKQLYLMFSQLKTLPPEVAHLQNLTILDLEGNHFRALPPEVTQMQNLVRLDLSSNQLSALSPEVIQLQNLTQLDISGNSFSALPTEIAQLQNLTQLDISGNSFSALPTEIAQLQNLTRLSLRDSELNTLPAEIAQLQNLTQLDVRGNSFSTLPAEIIQLQNLTRLNLRDNGLNTLPVEIAQLQNLMQLDLSANLFNELPITICQLKNLTELYLWDNKLTELPLEISKLQNLTSIYLGGNSFREISNHILQLSSLRKIDLRGNKLSELPSEISRLKNLMHLYLRGNKLKTLPSEINQLLDLRVLSLQSNPFEKPPLESLDPEKDFGDIDITKLWAYFRQLQEDEFDYLHEAKLLVVGAGGAGKTSLVKRIQDETAALPKQDGSTRGIDIDTWTFTREDGREFQVNLWDFGGQQIYHATHQFFLTKRSLYLLVVDTREQDREADLYEWLNRVELFGEDSPVAIIKNCKDDRVVVFDEKALRGRFDNLKESFDWNLARNDGRESVMAFIRHQIQQLPHIGQGLPKRWLAVRRQLEAEPRNSINLNEYLEVCEQHGFTRRDDKLQLSDYLHDLGVFLHFQDDELLERLVILKPTWATDAVYQVLDTQSVQANRGRFNKADLKTIWADDQYAEVRPELLQLMKNFGLCYALPGEQEFIIPQLLNRQSPEYDWDDNGNLQVRYRYPRFMPSGILTRFIVAAHDLIENNRECVWRHGVVLSDDSARAEVIEGLERREIRLRLCGGQCRDLLIKLLHEFDKIHRTLHDLEYDTLVPCNCPECEGSQTPHFYKYDNLKRRQTKGRDTVECEKSFEDVSVNSLLDNIRDDRGLDASYKRKRFDNLRKELDSLEEKRHRLQQSHIAETREEEKMRLEKAIDEAKSELAQLEETLEKSARGMGRGEF